MSPTASSTKTAAIAGAVAGLLAAGLGGYLYHQAHRPATAPAAGAAAPAFVATGVRPAPGAAAAVAPTTSATTGSAASAAPDAIPHPAAAAANRTAPAAAPRGKAQAMQALLALPELQAWSERIEQRSGGAAHGALIEYDPEPRLVKGNRYWQLTFVENSAQAAQPWESFLVAARGDEILVEDLATDGLLSLERWRKEKQPMRRRSAD